MTYFTIILVCDDNMIFLLHIALLAQCQSCMISVCWLHPCMLVCLVYAFTCLFVCVTSHALGQGIVQVCTHPYTRNLKPLLGALLAGTCVVRNSIQWIYRHNPNLHLFIWVHTYLFVYLFVCFCLLASLSFMCLLYVLCLPSLVFACLHVCFAYGGRSTCLTSKKQTKGHRLVYFRRLTLREVHYFLSLSFRTMYNRFRILGFSSCALLWVTHSGGYIFILALFFQCKYCDCFIM